MKKREKVRLLIANIFEPGASWPHILPAVLVLSDERVRKLEKLQLVRAEAAGRMDMALTGDVPPGYVNSRAEITIPDLWVRYPEPWTLPCYLHRAIECMRERGGAFELVDGDFVEEEFLSKVDTALAVSDMVLGEHWVKWRRLPVTGDPQQTVRIPWSFLIGGAAVPMEVEL